jgi:hypothetical protein
MITDLIVLGSLVFTVAFIVAWVASPALRAWIERPKHRFHDLSRRYDRSQRRDVTAHQEQVP